MSYQKLIAAQTGETDTAVTGLIEELMRTERTTLDALTPAEFRGAVIDAVADAAELESAGMLRFWCESAGIPVPSQVA